MALRQGLANIDLSTVFDFFCSNAAVAIKQSHNILNGLANTKVDNNCNHGGDNSEQFVAIHICENLICVLLDLVVAATPSEIAAWSNALDKCVSEAEKFPAHSFIGHVLRWLKEKRKGF